MARVLALHLDKTLALPPGESCTGSIDRHLEYGKRLEYYCIITKTMASWNRPAFSPADGVDVLPSNSGNRLTFVADALRMAGRVIEEHEIDVLTLQSWRWLGLVGLALRCKYHVALNVQVHSQVVDNPYYRREGLRAWLGDRIGRFVISQADTLYVNTRDQQRRLAAGGFPAGRIYYASFSIPSEPFYRASGLPLRDRLLSEGFSHVALWVGNMTKARDLATLLRSFVHVVRVFPGALLLLVGDGPECARARRLTGRLGLDESVRFCGYVPYDEVPGYFAASDVVCVSSLYEGTCRVIHEAMASARPVVSTDVAGALDAVQDGVTGLLVPRRSPVDLAAGLLRLFGDEQLARRMGLAGREVHAREFSMERHCAGFVEMWQATSSITRRMRGEVR